MRKYFAPEAEIYNYKFTDDVLSPSAGNYGGNEQTTEEANDPFGN